MSNEELTVILMGIQMCVTGFVAYQNTRIQLGIANLKIWALEKFIAKGVDDDAR